VVFTVESHPTFPTFKQCNSVNYPLGDRLNTALSLFIMYFLPLVIIIFSYGSILWTLFRTSNICSMMGTEVLKFIYVILCKPFLNSSWLNFPFDCRSVSANRKFSKGCLTEDESEDSQIDLLYRSCFLYMFNSIRRYCDMVSNKFFSRHTRRSWTFKKFETLSVTM